MGNKAAHPFFFGAAMAAYQVEGNNRHSDFWVMEHTHHSDFAEPSGDAVDHYHRYAEDIALLKKAGLNAYRFSIEWGRIEPEEGKFDGTELEHYRKVLRRVHESFLGELLVTENGIATADDARRCAFLTEAVRSVREAKTDGVPVTGYFCWSLLDNFEWQAGYSKTFGLIAVERTTQTRKPKESLYALGALANDAIAEDDEK